MNKKAIYALTAIALQSVIFQSANAESTVRITSNITASPCTVDTTSSDINLGVMTASYLNNPSLNQASDYTLPLVIKLIGCPETTTSVSATFSGTPSHKIAVIIKTRPATLVMQLLWMLSLTDIQKVLVTVNY